MCQIYVHVLTLLFYSNTIIINCYTCLNAPLQLFKISLLIPIQLLENNFLHLKHIYFTLVTSSAFSDVCTVQVIGLVNDSQY